MFAWTISMCILICLASLYVEGAVGYIDPVPKLTQEQVHRNLHYKYDDSRTANPMGRLAIGHEWVTEKTRTSFEIRHESWIGTHKDYGQNSAWVSLRVYPFK